MSILEKFTIVLENHFYKNIAISHEEYNEIVNGIIDLCMCDIYQPIHDCIYKFLLRIAQDCKFQKDLTRLDVVCDYIQCFTSYYDYYTILPSTDSLKNQIVEITSKEIVKEHNQRVVDLILVFGKLLPPYVLTYILWQDLKGEISYFNTMQQIENCRVYKHIDVVY